MADRNTKIRGNQIRDLTITADDIANDTITGTKLADAVAAAGLIKDGSENLAVGAGDGIDVAADAVAVDVTDFIDTASGLEEDISNNIKVNIDSSFLEFLAAGDVGAISLKNDSITEIKLDIYNNPVNGYFLKYTTVNGMEWADVAAGYVELTDVIANEAPSGDINGSNTDFTLANSPASGTVQVYLNGIMQQPGSGLDYQLSGTTISFVTAPDTGDIILVNYVKA